MRSLVRALFISAVATAGFAALVTAVAPQHLRDQLDRSIRPPSDHDAVLDGEIDADDLTDAQALAMLRELARDLDFDEEPA